MKVGAVYNFFNCEELLEASIRSIREAVDFVGISYQTISHYGNKNLIAHKVAKDLLEKGLVDRINAYSPFIFHQDIRMSGVFNSLKKRNVDMKIARQEGCTHFLGLDCDEFYDHDKLTKAIQIVKEGDYDSAFCQMETYYKYPECQLYPKWEGYYVPLLYKIRDNIHHKFIENWDENMFVDNTRRQPMGKKYVFSRDEIVMEHFSYLRNDIGGKYQNTNYATELKKEWISQLVKDYNKFDIKKDKEVSVLMSDGIKKSKFKIVDNKYNIKL